MKFECKDVKKEREHERTDVEKHEGVSSLYLKENCSEENTICPYIQHQNLLRNYTYRIMQMVAK